MKSTYIRRIEAQQRADIRAKRSDSDQLALIGKRPGASKREYDRIMDRIELVKTDKLDKHGYVAPINEIETLKVKKPRKPRAKKS